MAITTPRAMPNTMTGPGNVDAARQKPTFFTTMMGLCFAYSVLDLVSMEEHDCMISMQLWLGVSFVLVVLFWALRKLGEQYSHAGNQFIVCFRQTSLAARLIVYSLWGLLVPFYFVWTVCGTLWFHAALKQFPDAFSVSEYPWLILFWQVISYLWILGYIIYFVFACVIEYRVSKFDKNMNMIETEEMLARWGRLGPSSEPLTGLEAEKGLQASDIQALPSRVVEAEEADGESAEMEDCPICLSSFNVGDKVRSLPGCSHCFHQACIDLWLLRQKHCPMCKNTVSSIEKRVRKEDCGDN